MGIEFLSLLLVKVKAWSVYNGWGGAVVLLQQTKSSKTTNACLTIKRVKQIILGK